MPGAVRLWSSASGQDQTHEAWGAVPASEIRAIVNQMVDGAVPLAAVLEQPDHFADRRVGLIISGGNVDLDHLPW